MFQYYMIALVVLVFGFFVLYNKKFLHILGVTADKSEGFFYKIIGRHIRRFNINLERTATIKKTGIAHSITLYFKEIITNLDMAKDNVTVAGLLTFITSMTFSTTIVFVILLDAYALFPIVFAAVFFFIVIIFNFTSLMRFEKKEADIMDTEDLIAMDVKGGVHNAILRYHKSFHPSMKPYFEEFIDNIDNKGYSFREAMIILNDKLGQTFTDFAQKSIQYEERGDDEMSDIFGAIVEINRYKRTIRYENNIKFNKLRMDFLIATGVIAIYGVFTIFSDSFLAEFFLNSTFAKLLIIGDLVIVSLVLAYIASIKAKLI